MADSFNDFFSSVCADNDGPTDPVVHNSGLVSITDSAFLPPITKEDLYRLLHRSRKSRAVGLDGISAEDIRRNVRVLADPLLFIFNRILDTCIIPDALKRARVIPIFKGGDASKPENYRPISVLPFLAQLLERHVLETIEGFVLKHNILSSSQYGFVPGRSTHALFEELSDLLYQTFEHNQVACGLFLDISKAFDSVSHSILCAKLHNYGFRGHFHAFIQNYLVNRSQIVCIGDQKSSLRFLNAGVPQGSVLSPLLFNLYVCDLALVTNSCTIFQYADDTLLVSKHMQYEAAVALLQSDIKNVMNWFRKNRIKVSARKTKLVCFRNPLKAVVTSQHVFLHGSDCIDCVCAPVQYADSVKYLGVYFETDLSWNIQMARICARLRNVACVLYRIRSYAPTKIKEMIAHALGYSHIRYGICCFFNCSGFWKHKIDSLLKSILKSVAYNQTTDNLFRDLEMPDFESLFRSTIVMRYFWSNDFREPVHKSVALRRHPKYVVPQTRTRYGKGQRRYYIPHLFNNLPSAVMDQTNLSGLKKALKAMIE